MPVTQATVAPRRRIPRPPDYDNFVMQRFRYCGGLGRDRKINAVILGTASPPCQEPGGPADR